MPHEHGKYGKYYTVHFFITFSEDIKSITTASKISTPPKAELEIRSAKL
jgi:hypothetical protein